MARGGYRPGSGRKKGPATIEREKMKDYIAQRVAENGEALVSVLLSKALKGDIMAMRELFDRGYGKAPQAITGAGGGSLVITFDSAVAPRTESSSEQPSTL